MKSEINVGDKVRYSPIIGGKNDGKEYVVKFLSQMCGQQVAFLERKSGCVDIDSLTKIKKNKRN